MTFYDNDFKRLFLEYVHDANKAIVWVNAKGIVWAHAMIYYRRTRNKIDGIINNNSVINKRVVI